MQVLGLLLRVGCVFALLFVVLHVLKRTDGFKNKRAGLLQVVGSTRLGKGAAVTVVRMGDAEYLLGVTDHAVTLLTSQAVAAEAVVAPAPVSAAPADFAATLRARLGSAPATAVPPTPAEFLRSAYRVARRRPADSTDVSADAVTAALASVRGDAHPGPDAVVLPLPRTSTEGRTRSPQSPPRVPDGSATPTSRHALRRAVARKDALRHEEHLWTRSCRPTSRTSDLDSSLA
ncbi:MAG: hypothetical protein JWM64_852 [Frankiales bacterium]|nr:hypothetical protein [Frankiales bacterium]